MHRPIRRAVVAAALLIPCLQSSVAMAQAPAAAPRTFWNWLGIPSQPCAGIINRGGNFPECEKKPPLKGIADPANLESKNPAIAKAAEIKAQEDMAAQKIKAIKYLATIGCGGCYEGVDKALAAALDDCTEAVRYEAVLAIIAASACGQNECVQKCVRKNKTCKEAACDCWVGCMKRTCATMHLLCGKAAPNGVTLKSKLGLGCQQCGPRDCQPGRCACGDGNCCTSEILNKLSTMAFEKDDRGCWKEPSPRVRAMARQALRACGPNIRPWTPLEAPVPEEVSVEPEAAPGKKPEAGETKTPETGADTKPAQPETITPSTEKSADADAEDVVSEVQISDAVVPTTEATSVVVRETPAASDADPVDSAVTETAEVAPQPVNPEEGSALQPEAATAAVLVDAELPIPPTPDDVFATGSPEQTAKPVAHVAKAHPHGRAPKSQSRGFNPFFWAR